MAPGSPRPDAIKARFGLKIRPVAGKETHVSLFAAHGTRMTQVPRKITDDPYGAAALVRRLIADQGLAYWPQYLKAFLLMGVSAAATACSAWLLGEVINQTYINRSVRGIVLLSIAIIVLFALKGLSTYGHTVILSKIGNSILANNQRRLFAKLMRENVGFYAERHSSEFLARLSAGAHRQEHFRGRGQRQQDGAGAGALQPADGNARRLRHRRRADVWRLSRALYRGRARTVLLVRHRVPAGL
jgi:hypothetical protein